MTSIPLRHISPELRPLCLEQASLAQSEAHLGTSDGSPLEEIPPYLLLARNDVVVQSASAAPDLIRSLGIGWQDAPDADSLRSRIANLSIALSSFDQECRTTRVFAGNIYLASEAAVDRLLVVSGFEPLGAELAGVLDIMQNAELLYRFPVAFKFRGEHGLDRQCRLNGWGRKLAEELSRTPWAIKPLRATQARLRDHLTEHSSAYMNHLALCATATDNGQGTQWTSAQTLQIPVLT